MEITGPAALLAYERAHPCTRYTDAADSSFTVGTDAPWAERAQVDTWRRRSAGFGMALEWMSYPVSPAGT